MSTLSNLYIEKTLSEHPITSWVLSDDVNYISLISETNRQFYTSGQWTITNGTAYSESNPPANSPFENSSTSRLTANVPSSSTETVSCVSGYTLTLSNLDYSKGSITLGTYIYIENPYTSSIYLGYQYYNTGTLSTVNVTQTFDIVASDQGTWKFLSATLDLPTVPHSNIKLLSGMTVKSGGSSGDYDFYINGLSVGQWSEETNSHSLGTSVQSIPSTIALDNTFKVVPALQYSTQQNNGYYLAATNALYARNFGIPLVYGSGNVTKLFPHVSGNTVLPSLIFPGSGFLNQKGKYNNYTAEMWIRLNTDTTVPKKIFGPIANTDGLYVDGGFLSLVINGNFSSHYVGEWNRPMLIHIRYIKNNISLLLNGEQVISLSLSEDSLIFSTEFDNAGASQDWVAFYCASDIHPFEIDSFSIYSYSVPIEVAKRRWVWGQAIPAPESTNYSLNAVTAYNDYSFAKYTKNYNYPDFSSWNSGFSNNLLLNKNIIQFPDYQLPTFELNGMDYSDWLVDLHETQEDIETLTELENTQKYFSFRPTSAWDGKICHLYYNSLNILQDPLHFIGGTFELTNLDGVEQTLFRIQSKINGDYLLAYVDEGVLKYEGSFAGHTEILETVGLTIGTPFMAGVRIDRFAQIDSLTGFSLGGANKFFSVLSNLELYIGGDQYDSTFDGKIWNFGLDSKYSFRSCRTDLFDGYNIFAITGSVQGSWAKESWTPNFKLVLLYKFDLLFPDIATQGYWEDHIPLSYFGKDTFDIDGKKYFDLDFLQINIDYPEPMERSSTETTGSWTYQDLKIRYQTFEDVSYLQTYDQLDNNLLNGWSNYNDMSLDTQKYTTFNTDNNSVKGYVSFQKVTDGVKNSIVDFKHGSNDTDYLYMEKLRTYGVVEPDSSYHFWQYSAFEVTDGTIIYIPKQDYNWDWDMDFTKYSIVVHLDFSSPGILHNQIKFRDLQLASKVYERDDFSEIGTKFGTVLYPYRKTGNYYDFKGHNPISTYKGSTPHLYLNNNSGWNFKGSFSTSVEKGLAMSVNIHQGLNYAIGSLQTWIRFSDLIFPTTGVLIMSVDHKQDIYDFYLIGDSSTQRGKIYCLSRTTGLPVTGLVYSMNGNIVDVPYIYNEQWSVLGIGFSNLLDFSSYTGRIYMTGPIMFNNLSYYLANDLQQKQKIQSRSWSDVTASSATWTTWKTPLDLNSDGDYVDPYEHDGTWKGIYVVKESFEYNVSPDIVYGHYVGTDRIIFDDPINGIMVNPQQATVYTVPSWSITTKTPV